MAMVPMTDANVGCFAHARRKFMDAKKLQGKDKSGKADVALAKIQMVPIPVSDCTVSSRQRKPTG